MSSDEAFTSAELLARYRNGDDAAARDLFERYTERLTLLARSRLSSRLAARTDPEDVVLSAWRSFFVAARAGRYSLRRSGELWNLLASIAMHKLYRQVRKHGAEKRSIGLEHPANLNELRAGDPRIEPSAEEAVALADELELVMSTLDEFARRVLEMRLQGESHGTIAEATARSERTIRRTLGQIREALIARLDVAVP
ncbi:MAG: RNA polymerase sigma factor [Planctomycetaceae bacterium]